MTKIINPDAIDDGGIFEKIMQTIADELMTVSEIAEFLKVPASWVYEPHKATRN